MKFQLRREGENRHWPHYLFWGRMRTSTFALIVAFFFTWWLYSTYAPAPAPPPAPAQQVVPPGFVPDPEYTWVPRTKVERSRHHHWLTGFGQTEMPQWSAAGLRLPALRQFLEALEFPRQLACCDLHCLLQARC